MTDNIQFDLSDSSTKDDNPSSLCCQRTLSAEDAEWLNQYMMKLAMFLSDYSWMYDFPLINVLSSKAFEEIPVEWISFLSNISPEVRRKIPYGYIEQFWPESLKTFISESVKLSMSHTLKEEYPVSVCPSDFTRRGMSPKKIHEVIQMTETIHRHCTQTEANAIIDVGSGLGYLDEALCDIYNYQVIGIEVEESRYHGAQLRLKKQNKSSTGIHYVRMGLENNSICMQNVEFLILQHFGNSNETRNKCPENQQQFFLEKINCNYQSAVNEESRFTDGKNVQSPYSPISSSVCMVGLHCCGDLTSSMLQISTCIKQISSLVCLPCCYHKMAWNGKEGIFKAFPFSKYGRDCLKKIHSNTGWKISPFLMRLAAQQTRSRWACQTEEQHIFQIKNNAYRAVLQAYVNKEKLKLKKKKRNISWKNAFSSFDDYLKIMIDNYEITGGDKILVGAKELYEEMTDLIPRMSVMMILQVLLQPVAESLIFIDCIQYLIETNWNVSCRPIFKEKQSPRNIALIASKQ